MELDFVDSCCIYSIEIIKTTNIFFPGKQHAGFSNSHHCYSTISDNDDKLHTSSVVIPRVVHESSSGLAHPFALKT